MITSFSQDITNPNRRSGLHDYQLIHHKLSAFIDNLSQKISSRIQLVKQVYLDDYTEQVSIMSAELRSIRAALDEQLLKQRSNQRLFYLEEERDFFRAQVVQLNTEVRKLEDMYSKVKGELEETKNQASNYRKIVYDLQTRIYKLTYENIQIDKMREEQNNKAAATLQSTISATKGFMTDRQDKGRHRGSKLSEKGDQQASQIQQNAENGLLSRKKTNFSLRKLKPNNPSSHTFTPNPPHATPNNLLSKAEPCSREQILDRCLKELKKQIYYRNLNAKYPYSQHRQSNKINFDQEDQIIFQRFTKSDRKDLVYRFMSDPRILDEFYGFVFAKRKTQAEISKIQKIAYAKGVDAKFNTKMLQNFKAQFDKRIYDIKANRF